MGRCCRSGNPVAYYAETEALADSKIYNQKFTPVPAPEKKVTIPVPGRRKSIEEAETLASAFLKNLGFEGSLRAGGRRWGSGPPYPEESWRFALEDTPASQWEEVEVWIDTARGQVYKFSRSPKKEKVLPPFMQLSPQEAEQSALAFLAVMNEDTRDTVLRMKTRSLSISGKKWMSVLLPGSAWSTGYLSPATGLQPAFP